MKIKKKCTICNSIEIKKVIDLGHSSLANKFVKKPSLKDQYPLIVDFCKKCKNLQLRNCVNEEVLFKNYTYSTPNSSILDEHYSKIIKFLKKNHLLGKKNLLEIGCNNSYFLKKIQKHFQNLIGVDPAVKLNKNISNKITLIKKMFSLKLSQSKNFEKKFDIIIARHVLAHNSNPHKLLTAINKSISLNGYVIIENAYALSTFKNNEFDQIYHEHMFYYSITSITNLFKYYDFRPIDIFMSKIHGGTFTILFKKNELKFKPKIINIMSSEKKFLNYYFLNTLFNTNLELNKNKLSNYLRSLKSKNIKIGLYGASAKSFTFINYLNLNYSNIDFAIDTTPIKIGSYYPNTDIKIFDELALKKLNYGAIIITAWNYKKEILKKSKNIFKKGTKLIFYVPKISYITVK